MASLLFGAVSQMLGWSQPLVSPSQKSALNLWYPKTANLRRIQITTFLWSQANYFDTLLEEVDLNDLLKEPGDAVLLKKSIVTKNETPNRKWQLCYAVANNWWPQQWVPKMIVGKTPVRIVCVDVFYKQQKFCLKDIDKVVTLDEFIASKTLQPIQRPLLVTKDQLVFRENHCDSVADVFQLGLFRLCTLNLDKERKIPVSLLRVHEMSLEDRRTFANLARDVVAFGNSRILRIFAITDPSLIDNLCLVMENIGGCGVAKYVRVRRSTDELLKFAVQMSEGLRYLERFEFIHPKLSLSAFVLTAQNNIKLIVFGMCEDTFRPVGDDFNEVDRCRWLPPECLPKSDREAEALPAAADYTSHSMSYTFGLVLWSLFHAATLPFEDETAGWIQSAEIRATPSSFPTIDCNRMPLKIAELCLLCWATNPAERPNFKTMKTALRNYSAESKRTEASGSSTGDRSPIAVRDNPVDGNLKASTPKA